MRVADRSGHIGIQSITVTCAESIRKAKDHSTGQDRTEPELIHLKTKQNMSFFSGQKAEETESDGHDEQETRSDNTPHYHFIHSMLLPSTVKIQKELKGRKFKVRRIDSDVDVD